MLGSKKSAFGKRPPRKKSTLPAKRTTRSSQCLNWFTSQNLCYWKKKRNKRQNGANVFAYCVYEARIWNGINDQMAQFYNLPTRSDTCNTMFRRMDTRRVDCSSQKQLRRRPRTLCGAYKSFGIIMQVFASALPTTDPLEFLGILSHSLRPVNDQLF